MAYRELKIKTASGTDSVGDPRLGTHTAASTGVHGVTGAVVGTTDAQTVSSKVLGFPAESTLVSATAFNGWGFNFSNGGVQYSTSNAAGTGTINFRHTDSVTLNTYLAIGQTITGVMLITNGATAYYINAIQIDGNSVTPKWLGGSAPTAGNASSIDAYTFTIIKTANATFTVLASVVKFA